jgi:hypothetical protein
MMPETYIVFFVIAGLAWTGAALVVAAVWCLFMRAINPTPKPTEWERDWEEIERNLNR